MTIQTPFAPLLTLACCLALSGCASDDDTSPAEPEDLVRAHLIDTWGISTSGFDTWDGTQFEFAADGTATAFGEGTIHVRGLGAADVIVTEIVEPASAGGMTTLHVSLADGSSERTFEYVPEWGGIAFGGEEDGVAIDANPDGTYDVFTYDETFPFLEGEPTSAPVTVEDGVEALWYLREYGDIETASPYVFLFAFALAHSPAYEARFQVKCNMNTSSIAAQPAVCDVFKDFCDCAACFVLGRAGACEFCPEL